MTHMAGTAKREGRLRLAGVVIALVVGAAACGGDGGEGVAAGAEVRPFEEVQASELVFENDPTFPGRAIFRVTTTEPMICAIVWGETEALGNFNNSLNMNGTGIVQHDVFLPGAAAGETYFYRLQGSAADGTLYQSDLMTFTLPAAPDAGGEAGLAGVNLALGAAIVEVSSEFSDAWAAENAIDGDLATEWSSSGDGDDSFIVVDLGSAYTVQGLEFLTRTMTDGSATTTTYTVTIDGGETLGPFDAGNPADPMTASVVFTGQVLRFDVENSTGGNTGAIEIRVIEAG